jgi:hypothetical protein
MSTVMSTRRRFALVLAVLLTAAACSSGNQTAVKKRVTNPDQRLSMVSINAFSTSIGPVVVGEIRNGSSEPVEGVRVNVVLKDRGGATIGQQFGFTLLRVIPPGEKSAFSIPFPGARKNVGTVNAMVQADPRVVYQVVPVKVASQQSDTLGTDYEVTGTVANSTAAPIHYANVVATFYDKSGGVVGAAQDVSGGAAVPPGQAAAFRIILQEQAAMVANYKLAAEAQVVAQNH